MKGTRMLPTLSRQSRQAKNSVTAKLTSGKASGDTIWPGPWTVTLA